MNPWLSNHALVAYMLVGVPVVVWLGEMLVRAIERRVRERGMRRHASMRRHPAGSRVMHYCDCGAPVWNAGVHAQVCRLVTRAGRWQ